MSMVDRSRHRDGKFAREALAEPDVTLDDAPRPPDRLVKPKLCRKCGGDGSYMYVRGGLGACSRCSGSGWVETDRAVLAEQKANSVARDELWTQTREQSLAAYEGLQNLSHAEPERYEKAVASFRAGRTDVIDALEAYGQELRAERRASGAAWEAAQPERVGKWASYDDLHENLRNVLDSADVDFDVSTRDWQLTRVPMDLAAERIFAADPELAERFGNDLAAYHSWYMTSGAPRDPNLNWPSIEADPGSGEYLADGLSRFHSSVAAGRPVAHVMRSRPTES